DIDPAIARKMRTGAIVSNERCVKRRWKPTVTPNSVIAYIEPNSDSSTQPTPRPHRRMMAATRPISGMTTAPRTASFCDNGSSCSCRCEIDVTGGSVGASAWEAETRSGTSSRAGVSRSERERDGDEEGFKPEVLNKRHSRRPQHALRDLCGPIQYACHRSRDTDKFRISKSDGDVGDLLP